MAGLVYWGDGFRGWQAVAQSTVWSDGVVVSPLLFDDDLSSDERKSLILWSRCQDSNLRPLPSEGSVLPTNGPKTPQITGSDST